jgi:hypothetical protein
MAAKALFKTFCFPISQENTKLENVLDEDLFNGMNISVYVAGLPDGMFQTKNPNLVKFWWVLQWKMFVYFISPFGTFFSNLVCCLVIWYIFPVLVCCSKKNLATLVCTYKSSDAMHMYTDVFETSAGYCGILSGSEWNMSTKPLYCIQGCQVVYFQTKNRNLGKFWRFLH